MTTQQAPNASLLPVILYANAVIIQLAMIGVAFLVIPSADPPPPVLSSAALWPRGADIPTLVAYAAAAAALVAASAVPGWFAQRRAAGGGRLLPGAGPGHPLSEVITPYIMRLCLAEVGSFAGLVLAFLIGVPTAALPLAVIAIGATLWSAPTAARFARWRRISG